MVLTLLLIGAAAALEAPPPQSMAPNDYDSPARREEILSGKAFAMPSAEAVRAYNEQRAAALDSRMNRLGMDGKAKAAFAARILKLPEFEAALKVGLEGLGAMMRDLDQMARTQNPAANCRLLLHMRGQLPTIIASARQQWDLMERELDAEAGSLARGKPL